MEHGQSVSDNGRALRLAQTATHFYAFGGVSNGTRVPDVNRMDLATGMWQSRASMPFSSEAPTCALMASTGIVYCTEGDLAAGSPLTTSPATPRDATGLDTRRGSRRRSARSMAKVFVAGGTTGFCYCVEVHDVATNTRACGDGRRQTTSCWRVTSR